MNIFYQRIIFAICLITIMLQGPLEALDRRNLKNAPPPEEKNEKEEIVVGPIECMQYMGPSSRTANPIVLRFYNTCEDNLYAKVCVQGKDGSLKTYTSGARIPSFGYFNLTLERWETPKNIAWTSGTGIPQTPNLCEIPDSKLRK